jgi:hypothetical protein
MSVRFADELEHAVSADQHNGVNPASFGNQCFESTPAIGIWFKHVEYELTKTYELIAIR